MASLPVLLFLLFLKLSISAAVDTITATNYIKDPESIVSSNGTFKLTFFSPPNSTKRYVGICYNTLPVMHVVWVANRNNPLTDSSGSFQISENGNLQVLNGKNQILWSSNNTQVGTNSSKAQLLESGNFVLLSPNGNIIWQSFYRPTDTLLPQMSLLHHIDASRNFPLQSWKSQSDPSQGGFVLGFGLSGLPELFIWENDRRYYRSGPWNGNIFIGIPTNFAEYQSLSLQYDGQGNITVVYSNPVFSLSNFELTTQGRLRHQYWDDATKNWKFLFQAPIHECDVYGKCGEFGSCNALNSPICTCLKGFEPKDKVEWNRGNWTSGCTRKRQLLCGIQGAKDDVFLRLQMMKVPADANWLQGLVDEDTCRSQCLMNCSCLAYAHGTGLGCMTWGGNLIDIQDFSTSGMDIYLRLAHSELGSNKRLKIIIAATVVSGTATLFAVAVVCLYCRRKAKQERKKELIDILEGEHLDAFEELPLFKFGKLVAATNNFHESDKLGEGGFGPVYRGVLEDGHEVAVKRLSGTSRQGIEEFMNEVLVISKLQHRNLVKLLGCCVEGQERLLIYEYMPNKSLDAILFDSQKKEILHWKTRSSIIEGLCRGLLYLHRDSRLKIIHRDLKAGNILLDENHNPKISDFGMARIFGGDQNQAATARIMGTYGYMPPEYAIEGRFSEKSDVFSFGVLMLEIITGKKTQWYDEESLSLLGHVWKLWSEDKVSSLIDPVLATQGFEAEILKFVHIGLLCVQEYAEHRPDISAVISMLIADSAAHFRQPKAPGFTRLLHVSASTTTQSNQKSSENGLSITNISCR